MAFQLDPSAHATTTEIAPAPLVREALRARATELAADLDALGAADRRRVRSLERGFAAYADQLRGYHDLFDAMVVPALAGRGALDQRALDTIAADHAWIDQLLGDLGDALGTLSLGLGADAWWTAKAADLAAALAHVLTAQLSREARLLTPLVEQYLDPAERDVVDHELHRLVARRRPRFSFA